jgi:hypothetical protein
MAIYDQGI